MLRRLEAGEPRASNAASELDRLKLGLERDGLWEPVDGRIRRWLERTQSQSGDREQTLAFLTLASLTGSPAYLPFLIETATASGLSAEIRIRAIECMLGFTDDLATETLVDLLDPGVSLRVRVAAAQALGLRGDAGVCAALETAAAEADLPALWNALQEALERLRG